ncbi:hypothetical protein K438DRAFT_1613633, partial [Mycena galopus ATCC 62051]
LDRWTRLEKAWEFEIPAHKLSAKGRPETIGKWIVEARGQKQCAPPVTNPAKFGKHWWTWWESFQPEWRVRAADGALVIRDSYGEWDDNLLHWGLNGLLRMVAGLYFWGCAVSESPDLQDDWEAAVQDVSWILKGLARKFSEAHSVVFNLCTCCFFGVCQWYFLSVSVCSAVF